MNCLLIGDKLWINIHILTKNILVDIYQILKICDYGKKTIIKSKELLS